MSYHMESSGMVEGGITAVRWGWGAGGAGIGPSQLLPLWHTTSGTASHNGGCMHACVALGL